MIILNRIEIMITFYDYSFLFLSVKNGFVGWPSMADKLFTFGCTRHLNCFLYLSFNMVLHVQTSPVNLKLHGTGKSSDWHIQSCGQTLTWWTFDLHLVLLCVLMAEHAFSIYSQIMTHHYVAGLGTGPDITHSVYMLSLSEFFLFLSLHNKKLRFR